MRAGAGQKLLKINKNLTKNQYFLIFSIDGAHFTYYNGIYVKHKYTKKGESSMSAPRPGNAVTVKTYSRKELIGFLIGLAGQNIIYNIIASGLAFYFQSVIFIPVAAYTAIFAVARVWDAVNDPMMGTIVDKTKTKWGKCKPYLLFVPAVIMITTILPFFNNMYAEPIDKYYVQFAENPAVVAEYSPELLQEAFTYEDKDIISLSPRAGPGSWSGMQTATTRSTRAGTWSRTTP